MVGTKKPPQNGAFFSHFGLNSGKIEGLGLICKGLKIPRCKNRTGSNPVSGTKALLQWECFFYIINLTARVVFYLNRLAEKYKIQNFCIIKNQIISF